MIEPRQVLDSPNFPLTLACRFIKARCALTSVTGKGLTSVLIFGNVGFLVLSIIYVIDFARSDKSLAALIVTSNIQMVYV